MAKMTVTRSFNGNLDASFSTYLNLKPNDSTLHSHAHQNVRLGCAVDDCEISIFDAQNYFNEGNNNNNGSTPPNHHAQINLDTKRVPLTRVSLGDLPRISSASSVDTPSRNNYRVGVGGRSFHATPTASSEASWNSQTGLLSNPPGSIKVSLRNLPTSTTPPYVHQKKTKPSSRSNWFFGRRCSCLCTGQKSLPVDEKPIQPITHVRSVIVEKPIMLKTVESAPVVVKQETVKASGRALMHQELTISPPKCPRENKNSSGGGGSPKLVAENEEGAEFLPAAENTHRIVATGRTFSDNATVAGFSFPILNNNPVKLILNPMRVTPPIHTPLTSDEPPRESLEVFLPYDDEETSPTDASLDLGVHRERGSFTFPASPKSRMTTVTDEDVASDASSDLFEIESFSTQTTTTTTCPVLYRRRDSVEEEEAWRTNIHLRRRLSAVTDGGMGGLYYPVRGTECYEPSEASIDWSVTTAEGIERNGGLSDGEEAVRDSIIIQEENKRRRGGGWNALLSCHSQTNCHKSSLNFNTKPPLAAPAASSSRSSFV